MVFALLRKMIIFVTINSFKFSGHFASKTTRIGWCTTNRWSFAREKRSWSLDYFLCQAKEMPLSFGCAQFDSHLSLLLRAFHHFELARVFKLCSRMLCRHIDVRNTFLCCIFQKKMINVNDFEWRKNEDVFIQAKNFAINGNVNVHSHHIITAITKGK